MVLTTVEKNQATILLHEFNLMIGNYTGAFMLTGHGVRLGQALQLNLEPSPNTLNAAVSDMSWSAQETRRRLGWAIFAMDCW